jgi:hypothetical protein
VSLLTGGLKPLLVCAAMVAGMGIHVWLEKR